MKTFEDLKIDCESSERFNLLSDKQSKQYSEELYRVKIAYENKIDIYQKFLDNKDRIQKQYVIPFLLGLSDEIIDGDVRQIQVKDGASGGIDIDSDFEGVGREKIFEYLVSKYGSENVVHVGTFSELGPSSAAKDVLRVYGIDFGESNEFTKILEKEKSWEENLKSIEANNPAQWKFYQKNKEILDIVPSFLGLVRQSGKHAGGICITDKPVYNYIPVDRAGGETISAFCESGSSQELDELGIVKYDILGISILDVIKDTINMIDEDIYLIEDDDGIKKIVGKSYIEKCGISVD